MMKIESVDGNARAGTFKTRHGTVLTPFFMPVATKATAKFVSPRELDEIGTTAIISNAFLLSLKPGTDIVMKAGGLHKFMDFHHTIFTDCGGFQMLREGVFVETKPDGIIFKDPYTGQKAKLTPEDIMRIQQELGSDVAMVLDFVPEYGSDRKAIEAAVSQTNRWAEWSKLASKRARKEGQQVFAIVHGGTHPDIRKSHASYLASLDFDGYALGGLCIGEPSSEMRPAVQAAISALPDDKPRYLMGVGSPIEILDAIADGVDMFDSAYPTQTARHNSVLTPDGPIKISSPKYADDMSPLDASCDCYACTHFSRAYIHFLSRVGEAVAAELKSMHNLRFLHRLVTDARAAIMKGEFSEFREDFIAKYQKSSTPQ